MSTVASTLSLNSSKNDSTLKVSERVKLVSLIRAWRAKYDKMHTAAQRHRDVIETLKQEIKQIKEERDRVNGHLTAELEKEKNVNNAEMGRLREQADTAQKEAAIESRILKEKLHKLQTDTKPIIDTYKERDAKMNSKIEEMTETLQKLTEERQTLEKELENLKSDSQKQIEEVKIENEVLKTRYQDKMQEVKQHIALSVAQIRRKAEEESMTSQNQLREEFDRKYETLQTRSNHSVKVVEIQLQADFQRKVKENEQKFEEQKCALAQHYEVELKTCRKKLELTKSKYRQSSKENQRLHEALATTRNKLQIMRTNLGSDVYDDVLQNHQQHVKAVVSRKNLLTELAMRMREIRDLRRELERHERNQKFGADVRWQEEGIKLEILHSAKIAEIDELKKMIRQKQVESIYKSRATLRPQPIETVLKTPDLGSFVHSDYHSNLPVRTSLSAGANSNRRGQERLKPPKQKQKRKIDKTKVEDRSAWLTRKNSTIQFNPVTGGEARQNMQIRRQMNDNRETTFQLQHL
uniref:CAP-Gly domain-containing linker protein 1-like n=1 Tax=Ciona intestinalis TaxID=7719 RepID=UPI00089DB1C1|nr:CAP-Gly domain-containing linker protein 1-like [Ciona intestinalis]|eukprot:XP_018671503.1 CAP-Gly domain-containing linker protein 1-like [Ciona intestinalis]